MGWTSSDLIALGTLVFVVLLAAVLWKPARARLRAREVARGVRLFRLQRERLEAKFFDLACSLGKPRGLRWIDCEWEDGVTFARDVHSGLLTAFVAVYIRFEAIEGGDMQDVEAVGTLRDAAALFHYRRGRWGTGGRALFNMNPQDALDHLSNQFEPVAVKAKSVPAA